MSDENRETSEVGTADGAIFGTHGGSDALHLRVAPNTGSEFNTLGERLTPRGCFRLEDMRFEFDSSFVKPEAAGEMPLLADLIERHTLEVRGTTLKPPLSIFGHADPVGRDEYNKRLSGRRAIAVYAMLVRDADMWEDLYSNPAGGDNWGTRSIQTMLSGLGYDTGPIDGVMGDQTKGAVRAFQGDHGLQTDGIAGPATRKELFRSYMDLLCGPRLVLNKEEDFLGKHADNQGKGDYQGCGEFNPVLMFSQEEHQRFEQAADKSERNAENAPNRRVLILLFPPGRRVDPELWPCPRASEGPADCHRRFFADADQRRTFQAERRELETTQDTLACRFYHLITDNSPCDRRAILTLDCFVFLKLFDDSFEHVLANQPYTLRGEQRDIEISGTTGGEGIVRHENIPDDHYMLTCGEQEEVVEVYYMNEKEDHDGKPWFMRVRGLSAEESQEENEP
jgi:outer membrane protein OmpA-like peptidoglycan-associated protein